MVDRISNLSSTMNSLSAIRGVDHNASLTASQGPQTLRDQLLAHAENVMPADKNQVNFTSRMSSALQSVAEAQNNSARITRDFELGRETDLSKVMINQQVSSLGFHMTLNIRNKVLTAYKDIMNMPV